MSGIRATPKEAGRYHGIEEIVLVLGVNALLFETDLLFDARAHVLQHALDGIEQQTTHTAVQRSESRKVLHVKRCNFGLENRIH